MSRGSIITSRLIMGATSGAFYKGLFIGLLLGIILGYILAMNFPVFPVIQ